MLVHLHTSRTFEAAHRLDFLPETHKCSRLHGHSYEVEVDVDGVPDHDGILVDYADIHAVIDKLDHRFLNDIIEKPTTERVAEWLLNTILGIPGIHRNPATDVKVRVYEGAHRHFCEMKARGF